jgi:hypothetical protein
MTKRNTQKIQWRTTVEDVNVRTSTQCSFYGKASTIGSLITGALKMEFRHSFLPSTEKSWVTNQVKLVILSDRNSVSDKNPCRRRPLKK